MFSMKDKKDLVKNIEKLNHNEKIEIFKIINNYTKSYTINANGFFISLNTLNDDIISKLYEYVSYTKDNRILLEKNEKQFLDEKDKLLKEIIDLKKNEEKEDLNMEENIDEDTEEKVENINNDDLYSNIDGSKISLKKLKPKYNGVKGKLLKNYKQNNIKTVITKGKKGKKEQPNVSNKEEVYKIDDDLTPEYINNSEEEEEEEEEEEDNVND